MRVCSGYWLQYSVPLMTSSIYDKFIHPRDDIFLVFSLKLFDSITAIAKLWQPPCSDTYPRHIKDLGAIVQNHIQLCHSCWRCLLLQQGRKRGKDEISGSRRRYVWVWAGNGRMTGGKTCLRCQTRKV